MSTGLTGRNLIAERDNINRGGTMKRGFGTVAAMFLLLAGCGGSGTVFHVTPNGNDSWSGTKSAARKPNGPFATLERARDAVREARRAGETGPVTINVAPGTYRVSGTLELGQEDGGTSAGPVIWRGKSGAVLTGGIEVTGWSPVLNGPVLKRLDPNARVRVRQADLRALGIEDFGSIDPSGNRLEVYWNGKFQTIARYPDEGWLKIEDVPQNGPRMLNRGLDRDKSPVPRGRHYGRFTYPGDRPSRWSKNDDIWVHGYWTWDWSDQYLHVAAIDTTKREIIPTEPHHGYGYTKGQRFYFLNILEELDAPGEWYLDRATGILYFIPPSPGGTVTVSVLNEPMIAVSGAENLNIAGFAFECSRAGAIRIEGGAGVTVAGCTFSNLGQTAVVVDGGTNNGVLSCDFHDLAGGGIILNGGDHATLTPAGNYAINNHIHHFAQRIKTYQPGVQVTGVGNRVAHNLIHDAPHTGIFLVTSQVGNDHIIEYNELFNLAQETGDVGAIYLCARNYTFRGTVIRYNYLHDLLGPGKEGVMGVYLDDFTSGTHIYGNVFSKAGRAAFVGGGRNNIVENNLFLECAPSIHLDARGLGWAAGSFSDNMAAFRSQLDRVKYTEPPYSDRYPELLTLLEDEPAVPKYNVFRCNVSGGGRWLDLYNSLDFDVFTMEKNLIADPLLARWQRPGTNGSADLTRDDPELRALLESRGNILATDAGIVVPPSGAPRLPEDSPTYGLGFKPIPWDAIGLYRDDYRTDPALPELAEDK